MSDLKKILFLFIGCLLITACASPSIQTEELTEAEIKFEREQQFSQSFTYQLKQRLRLARVARPLLTANLKACGKRIKPSLGVFLHSIDDYEATQQPAIANLLNTSEQTQVLAVIPNTPASQHLRAGDSLIAINGQDFLDGSQNSLKQLQRELAANDSVTLTVKRHKEEIAITLAPERVCDYPVILSGSNQINGYADGSSIVITQGLMHFARQDRELALIIAHEMAHNTQQHIPQRIRNSSLGLLLDAALLSNGIPTPLIATGIGTNLYTQKYEIEADIIGLELMHKAGYSIDGLDKFWQKMAEVSPSAITSGPDLSHPTTVERALLLRKAIQRLKHKTTAKSD